VLVPYNLECVFLASRITMATLTDSAIWDVVLLLVFILATVYFYYKSKFNYWKSKGVVTPKPVPLFGNFLMGMLQKQSPGQIVQHVYNAGPGEPYVGFYIFGR
jgi:cytochrome P450 family 6